MPYRGAYIFFDGTDSNILEPSLSSPLRYLQKLSGPGMRYEIGFCIYNGRNDWVDGQYPCGATNIPIIHD